MDDDSAESQCEGEMVGSVSDVPCRLLAGTAIKFKKCNQCMRSAPYELSMDGRLIHWIKCNDLTVANHAGNPGTHVRVEFFRIPLT